MVFVFIASASILLLQIFKPKDDSVYFSEDTNLLQYKHLKFLEGRIEKCRWEFAVHLDNSSGFIPAPSEFYIEEIARLNDKGLNWIVENFQWEKYQYDRFPKIYFRSFEKSPKAKIKFNVNQEWLYSAKFNQEILSRTLYPAGYFLLNLKNKTIYFLCKTI
ncbi:hypothetical protein AAEX28_13145 [Lentisphaerota bacterium WC36G]|nr:hypothetical protein LJT99_15975 [Lentisphaerae bacterium WC36]